MTYEEIIAMATCQAIIEHLRDEAPERTLTARAIINKGILERAYG